MKTALFFLGLVTGLAIYRVPHYTRGVWTSIPPATAADYPGTRNRYWNGGVEI